MEFREGLTMSFAIDMKMSSDHERQGFEHTKIKGKPITEAISIVWRDQTGKESAKK